MRIGELSRRSGVSAQLLRTWEQRYGLLSPDRTSGGFRVYSAEDERRVEAMKDHLDEGFSASAAARLVLARVEPASGGEGTLAQITDELYEAARAFDDVWAELNRVIHEALCEAGAPEGAIKASAMRICGTPR